MALFTVEGLTRAPWFENLDLELQSGEIRVLHGPSGSGKTLLLRALADLDPADRGTVRLDGVDRASTTPQAWRQGVHYVHQRAPRLAETVGASLRRAEAVLRARAGGAPITLGLPPELDAAQRTADLSGGEAQRLALHIAFGCGARVLLLDEATSALDREAALPLEKRALQFKEAGGAILWVSHESTLARRLGARAQSFPWSTAARVGEAGVPS